jgi:2,4-dienoyl-CoA reductase-like NADH-dependent reductase (Old Yellow Enzyme family)
MSSILFTPFSLRGLTLANRVVVSPMGQYNSVEGCATDWHLMHLGQFSLGGAALVMTEVNAVNPRGRVSHRCAGMWSDENERALKRVIDFCKEYGVAAHGLQLGHSGRKGSTQSMFEGGKPLSPQEGGWRTVAPSPLPLAPGWQTPEALSVESIADLVADFASAVRRAERIGYDLVELHGGHGYLVHQFLSPLSNQRTDRYGGSLENRMRLALEVFAAMREAWPADKPMGVRISATDWMEGGWDIDQAIVLSQRLKQLGCDYIDVSSGGLDLRQNISLGPNYQTPFSARIRAEAQLPTMTVGLITGARQAEEIVASGQADLVALARGAMWNPRWAWHAAEELGAEAQYAPRMAPCHPKLRPWVFPQRREQPS